LDGEEAVAEVVMVVRGEVVVGDGGVLAEHGEAARQPAQFEVSEEWMYPRGPGDHSETRVAFVQRPQSLEDLAIFRSVAVEGDALVFHTLGQLLHHVAGAMVDLADDAVAERGPGVAG